MSVEPEAASAAETRPARGLRRVTGLLPAKQWTYILSLLLPLAALSITFKVIRVRHAETVPGPLGVLDALRSDLLINAAMVVVWVAAFALVRKMLLRVLLLVLLHGAFIFLGVLSTANHFYFMKTGSMLDLGTLAMTFRSFDEFQGVLASEMGRTQWLLLLGAIGYGTIGPAVVTKILHGEWLPVAPKAPRRTPSRFFGASIVAGGTALVLSLLAALPGLITPAPVSRNATVGMVVDGVSTKLEKPPASYVPPTREDIPDQTRLLETARTEKRNVVMIYLESTRMLGTTLADPNLPSTPNLAELSRNALVADNAYAVLPHTSKSTTAAHCGVEPPFDNQNTEADPNGLASKCLPALLDEQGYDSVFFQSATEKFERRRELVKNWGYRDFHPLEDLPTEGMEPVNYFGYEDDIMLRPSREWAEQHRDRPFLMSYLTVTGHHDYRVPPNFPVEHLSDDPTMNSYLNAVRYQDRFVQRVIDQYKEMGLYDNTIFMVMADHGEGFGEHKLSQHDNTIYNEGIKIPLMVIDPKRFAGGQRVATPVQNMVALPTIVDLLGFDIAGGRYRTPSLLDETNQPPVRTTCFATDKCLAEVNGTMKYIHHFGNQPDEYFDLSTDPLERNNLIGQQDPARMAAIKDDLLSWQIRVKATYDLKRKGG